MARSEIWAKER